jgi:decaprenylphospho-beta-D-erythro-pentofuranosid-2-ulose 2-reductase
MTNQKHIVIIGATSGMAEHCARLWVQAEPVRLTLVGRNRDKTAAVAADLRIRNPACDIDVMTADFLDPASIRATVDTVVQRGSPDIVLIAQGTLPEQAKCQTDLQLCRDTLEINGISPVLFAEAFIQPMEQANHGTLAIIGSVAGDRGRKSNYVYGAAKGLVSRYAEGLQHRLAKSKVKVVLIKPGPTDTPMTAAFKAKGMKMAPVEEVAWGIVKAVEKGKAAVYVPWKWQAIMRVIRHIPSAIFARLNI